MGNQSAVFKGKSSEENFNQYIMNNKSKKNHLDADFSSEIFSASSNFSKKTYHAPLSLRLRRPPPIFNQTDKKSKEFFDDIKNTIPTVFRWGGQAKSIHVSGSFNDWKSNIPLTKCDSETFYTIINCTPGSHVYKFFIDGVWYHDPTKPTVKNSYGTLDNVMQVKMADPIVCDALLNDEYWCSIHHSGSIDEMSISGDYSQTIPCSSSRTSKDFPMALPSCLVESILDLHTSPNQEPSLLPHPHYVQVNHMYASSITDGIVCLSMTIRYRTKFITVILYNTIPL